MGGFNIIKQASSDFIIPEDSLETYVSAGEGIIEIKTERYSTKEQPELFFVREAFNELNEHINWGKSTSANIREQGGILVGTVFKDKKKNNICGIVYHIIRSVQEGDATYIQFTHDDWIQMYREFDDKYTHTESAEVELRVIGWYHTHPNMPVNISGIDRSTHINFFPNDWQFSVILNPQKKKWAVYNGRECENCNGTIYADASLIESINTESSESIEMISRDNEVISSNSSDNVDELEHTDSFNIKRRSFSHPKQPVNNKSSSQGRSLNHTTQSVAVNNYANVARNANASRYNGYSQDFNGILYYFPYHRTAGQKNYIISEKIVKKLIDTIDEWGFTKNESVCFIYNLCSCFYTRGNDGIEYYRLYCYNNEFFAEHLICANSDSEFLNCGKDDVFSKHGRASIAVEFSNSSEPPSYPKLCDKYSSYDCVLLINVRDVDAFWFFNITKQASDNFRQSGNFKIKKMQITANAVTENNISWGFEVVELLKRSILSQLSGDYIETTLDVNLRNGALKMKKTLIPVIGELIHKHSGFSEPYTIVVSYKIPHGIDRGFVSLSFEKFGKLWFWIGDINNGLASFKNLDDEITQSKLPRFALVLSNRDIDEVALNSCRKKLGIAHTVAFCLNVCTGNYKFYRL